MKIGSEKIKFSPQNRFKLPQINQIGIFPIMINVFMTFYYKLLSFLPEFRSQ